MKCYRAQVRHTNKLCKIIKKNRVVSVLFCLLWLINNSSNVVSIIHLYVAHQVRQKTQGLTSFTASSHRAAWCLCFLCPVPSSLYQLSCPFPSPPQSQKPSSAEEDGHFSMGFSKAKISLELGLVLPRLAGKPCSLLLPERQRGKHLETDSALPPSHAV